MQKLFSILNTLLHHPLAGQQKTATLLRFLQWQITSRLRAGEKVMPWIAGCNLIVKRGFHAGTGCLYTGLPEFEGMAFLLHFLHPEDVFVDAGANIGTYSILAAGACGAKVLAFEPAPGAFSMLQKNVSLNHLENKVQAFQAGVGEKLEVADLTLEKGIQNHIAIAEKGIVSTKIQLLPLDEKCENQLPLFLKIDVEGYETAVLRGAKRILRQPALKAILLEKMGLGERFGFDENILHEVLTEEGFKVFSYLPFKRKLLPLQAPIFGNNLYLRDLPFIEQRLKNAPLIKVLGKRF